MIIRELITLFGFEVDEKGAKNVEKRIDGMKQGLGGLGKLLGVTIAGAGAKAFFSIGQRAERAEFNLKRFAGTDFNNLRRQFDFIKKDLNSIREGAADVVTEKQFDIAAAGFLKVFGRGKAQFDAFRQIFTFAAKQATITGNNVNEIFNQIQSGIQGGGFEALLDLPGFDIFRKQLLEFQQQAIDPGDPGGRIAIQNRLRAILAITTEAAGEQNEALREVPKELLEVDRATAKTKDTLEELGKTVNNLLVPAFKGFNVVLKRFNELISVGQQEETAGGAFRAIINELRNPKEAPKSVIPLTGAAPAVFPGARPGAAKEGDNIIINNNFTLAEGTSRAVGKEAFSVFQQELINAKRSLVKTEE